MKKKIRRYFITGIVVLLPIVITINILFITVRFADNILGKYINPYLMQTFGQSFFGLGLLAVIILIFVAGILGANVFIKRILPFLERWFLRIPLVPQIYPSIKQLVSFLFSDQRVAFKKVVLFEYPHQNTFTIGFVTNEFSNSDGDKSVPDSVCIYVSSAPNPITGFLVIVPKKDVTYLDMSIEEAFKIIISGGVLLKGEMLKGKLKFKDKDEDV